MTIFPVRPRIPGSNQIGSTSASVAIANLARMPLIELVKNKPAGCPEAKEMIKVSVNTRMAGDSATFVFNEGSHQYAEILVTPGIFSIFCRIVPEGSFSTTRVSFGSGVRSGSSATACRIAIFSCATKVAA